MTAPEPPQHLEAEENVIGAILLAPSALDAASEEVWPDDFYRRSHGVIFARAQKMRANDIPLDAITMVSELEKHGELAEAGGRDRVFTLAALVPASANAAHWARIVREKATLRRVVAAGWKITEIGWEQGDALETLERIQAIAFELSRDNTRSELERIGPGFVDDYRKLVELYQQGIQITGVPTGFHQLDGMTAGFQPGNLIVLAARPSMGKTALALGIAAHNILHHRIPVLLFTLEMSVVEVRQRLLAMEASIDLAKLRIGDLNNEEWTRVGNTVGKFEDLPMYVDDQGDLTMIELRARARRLKLREPELGLVIVDYLQLMASGTREDNRVLEIGQISRSLKGLARELDVPVLALSQLSRGVEQRADKHPMLSDLRDSGAIEQDADLVLFPYREEYYSPDDLDKAGLVELSIAKHRNGPTGLVNLVFVKKNARFSEDASHGSVAPLRRAARSVPTPGDTEVPPDATSDPAPAPKDDTGAEPSRHRCEAFQGRDVPWRLNECAFCTPGARQDEMTL